MKMQREVSVVVQGITFPSNEKSNEFQKTVGKIPGVKLVNIGSTWSITIPNKLLAGAIVKMHCGVDLP